MGAANLPVLDPTRTERLIYSTKQNGLSALIKYNVQTRLSTTIYQAGVDIAQANISPDGQWVVLLVNLQQLTQIQLVRADGQDQQTLYCAPANVQISGALLSPDNRSLVFNQVTLGSSISTLYLLDLTNGQLRTLLDPTQAGYPQSAPFHLRTTVPFSAHGAGRVPLVTRSSGIVQMYAPFRWRTNSSLFLSTIFLGAPAPPNQLYLLLDTTRDASQQRSNLQHIATTVGDNLCLSFDLTPDNQQLICSQDAPFQGSTLPSAIQVRPVAGGAFQPIYHNTAVAEIEARAASNSALVFVLSQGNQPDILWKINIDGSGLTQLARTQVPYDHFQFAQEKTLLQDFNSNSLISPDGVFYALGEESRNGNVSSVLLIQPLAQGVGGASSGQLVHVPNLQMVGWVQV